MMWALRGLREAVHGLGSLAFASDCLLCREPLERPLTGPLCPGCLDSLPRLEGPYCGRCGLPFEAPSPPEICGPCAAKSRGFRRARALYPYVNEVRDCLHALKYGGRRRIGTILAASACERWVVAGELSGAAATVAVPVSRARRRERGYNQSAVIARAVARRAGIAFAPRVLEKKRETPPQTGLSASARRRNLAGSFRANLPGSLAGANLLLVDDVFTTGATAEAAASALVAGGAGSVDVLTLARVP
ncbi:MAG TPA: ComF family protein [Vicinamibacteria bacterium]|nr:ComF family protein [Vicinamibacteria bacterium]